MFESVRTFPLKEPITIKAGQMVELLVVDGEMTIRPIPKPQLCTIIKSLIGPHVRKNKPRP